MIKFPAQISEENQEFIQQLKNFIQNIRKERKKKRSKKPINNSLISLFYDSPEMFFTKFKKSLKYSSYFDICGNSIFMHYFYILYEKQILNKKRLLNNKTKSEKIKENENTFKTKSISSFF